MKIILINGQPGTGKSTIGSSLKNDTLQSAYIDADALVDVNPMAFDADKELLLGNTCALIRNFLDAGYVNIFAVGITRNQELLDAFFERSPKNAEIIFIWLHASKEVRMKRKRERARDGADKDEHFDMIDKMYPDARPFVVNKGVYLEIDTSDKTAQEVLEEIKKKL